MTRVHAAEKFLIARTIIVDQPSLFIHVDPSRDGVSLPEHLMSRRQVVLEVGLEMPVPIPDLNVDTWGFHGTLSFGGMPFTCRVPWSAVFALVGSDRRGSVWSDDMPPEILSEMRAEHARQAFREIDGGGQGAPGVRSSRREIPSWMRVIDGEKK